MVNLAPDEIILYKGKQEHTTGDDKAGTAQATGTIARLFMLLNMAILLSLTL